MKVVPAGSLNTWEQWLGDDIAQVCFRNNKPFICDLQQKPHCGITGGPDFPSQLTHGTFCVTYPASDGKRMKIASPFEALQAMGFNLLSTCCPKSAMEPIFRQLSPAKLQKLAGNGMQLTVEAAWMFYCIMNVARRDDRLLREPSMASEAADEEAALVA